jgi:hypothetical protein
MRKLLNTPQSNFVVFHPCDEIPSLEIQVLKGHDFSRAVNVARLTGPLGPEESFSGVRIKFRSFSVACLATEEMQ